MVEATLKSENSRLSKSREKESSVARCSDDDKLTTRQQPSLRGRMRMTDYPAGTRLPKGKFASPWVQRHDKWAPEYEISRCLRRRNGAL